MGKKKEDETLSAFLQSLIQRLNGLIARDYYKEMRDTWIKMGIIVLASDIVGLLLGLYLPPIWTGLVLPESNLPILDPAVVCPALYAGTLGVCSIILGFSAVCSFFFLQSCQSKLDLRREDLKKFDKAKKPTIEEKGWNQVTLLEWKFYWKMKNAVTRYTGEYLTVNFFLVVVQTVIFFYSMVSGWMTVATLVVCLNVLILVLSGVFPLINMVLSYGRDSEETSQ
ncbi:MAG: hypothetical protein ACFE7I_09840 [Candidatus Hodarchaeota archaeon]